MEFIIGVGTAIVSRLAEYTVVLARRLCHYTSDVDNLRARVQQLNDARQNLQGRVDEASGKGEDIHDEVQNWLTRAPGISQGAADFLNNNRDRASISCCSVQIPNLVSRRKLSREARQMVEDLQREIEAAQRFGAVASRPALYTVIETRGDYEDFGSRKTILEDIMKALKDPNFSRIGVYGMGGSGKTMLAKEVARRATEAKLFTEVAMTTVSQTPDFIRMQQDVAEKIKLDLGVLHGVPARADQLQRQLQHELKEGKSILIILDDIWEEINLIEVGIHLENEGCKILMTSRSQDVLGSMGNKPNFSVAVLPAEEAMNFFKTIVGDIIEESDFRRLATDVVKECGGLPLAIRTVAYTLKNHRRLSVWRNALVQLQNSAPTIIDGMLKKVYPSIRLSYDFLESDDEKSLLLLCSLFGEDRNIRVEDLMMCSVGLGMFADLPPLARYVRMRVDSLIIRLKARCLLLDGDDGDGVKMHDIIRDVALLIASEKGGMYSVILKKEDCWSLNMKKLRDSKVLSLLPHSDFNQLPERLECSELELFLLLSGQGTSIPIPIPFFDDSKDRLKSLFFDRANLVTLPPSFHSLQNLQTLCLRGCVLEDATFIGDLKNLQILDLSESTIMQLPIKVAQLSRLQLLNLDGCRDLKLIEPNVISSLKQLEELYIAEQFKGWEVGEVDVSRRSNVNLAEIENLQQLTSLSLRVPDAKTFPKDFKFSEKLERYQISIGDPLGYSTGISRSLLLNLHERSQLTVLGLESLMKRSEGLILNGLIDVKNVVYDLDSEGFCDLKRLYLKNSDGVQYIVDYVDQQIHPRKAFPVLETLRLEGLRNLERICHGKLPEDSFKNLREISVWSCDKLKNVFPLSIFRRLHSIEVYDCKMMEEVVGHVRSEDNGAVELPELRSMILWKLPKMVKFMSWSEAEAAGGSSSVESPDPFFGEKVVLPSLEDLTLNKLGAKKLCADQLASTSYMPNLSSLYVRDCDNLKYVSSFATAKSCLIKLKKLEVKSCRFLEEVLVITDLQGEDDRSLEKISLPQLKYLKLYDLPYLKRFCKNPHELKMLETNSTSTEITANRAKPEEMEFSAKESLFNEMLEFPGLETLDLDGLNAVERVWQLQTTCYMVNITSLHVGNCNSLKYLFSLAVAERLVKLQNLLVENCEVMEYIVVTKKLGEEGRSGNKILFPQLKSLTLSKLSTLRMFCHEELQITCYMVNLTSLEVRNCKSLKYLFSLAVAERLVKLKNVLVENCEVMEVIVVTKKLGEEGRSGNKILFPQLEYLMLSKLPALRKFYHEEVILCRRESLSTDWSEDIVEMLGMSQSSSTLSLCHRQLRELELDFSHQDKPFAFSICELLQRCHNLEKLQLNGLLVNVICKDRQNEVGAAAQKYPGQLITRLRELRLDNVPKLRHLFGEPENDHPVGGALHPVKTLFVSIWKNLTILEVSFCHRLTYLLASSMATSLVKLKEMRVTDCNRLTEIITDSREDHDREFVLPQLEILVLRHLPNLGSFFSGNNVIRFPKLEKLFVSQCPEMRSFSHGIIISSSMLNTIIAEISPEWMWEYTYHLKDNAEAVREHWDGDVNTTVRELWEDDSDLALQQLFAEADDHVAGEGTSLQGTRL